MPRGVSHGWERVASISDILLVGVTSLYAYLTHDHMGCWSENKTVSLHSAPIALHVIIHEVPGCLKDRIARISRYS